MKSYQFFVRIGHYTIAPAVTCRHERLLYGLFNNIPGSMKDIIYGEACTMDKLLYKMAEKVNMKELSQKVTHGEAHDNCYKVDGKKSKKK